MRLGCFRRTRATVAALVASAALSLPGVPPAQSAENPHNLSSCSACHATTPRFGVDNRYSVTYTTSADDPGLCAGCHQEAAHRHPVRVVAGSGPAGALVSPYLQPGTSAGVAGKIVCTSCHFIHASDTRYGLLRGFPGSPDPRNFRSLAAFCEECHGPNLAKRSAHAGGEGSCVNCHPGDASHAQQDESPPTFKDRCVVCHRGKPEDHYANITPFGKRRECLLCHDRHGVAASSPGLLSEGYLAAAADNVFIRPHFRRGLCFTCHTNTDDYELRDGDLNALCDRCHASGKIPANIHPLRKVPASIVPPKGWPLTDGALTCLTCHEQGHEDQPQRPWMLRGGPYVTPRAACRNCHKTTDLEASRIHQDINEDKSCEMCHKSRPKPGTDTIKSVTFIADPDLLCLRCHDQNAGDGTVHHGGVMGREVGDGHIPAELPLFNGRVICATCHNPHLAQSTGARLREYLDESSFCIGCHRE